MLHLSRRVDTPEDADAFLSSPILARAIAEARSVLVQVFWSSPGFILPIAEAILRCAPEAVLVGADSAGQISDGLVSSECAVLSVSCFAQARLKPLFLDIGPGGEGEAGRGLGASLSRSEDIKAALLLVPTLSLDAAALVRGLREGFPSLLIFGGGAAQKPGPGKGVLFGTTVSARGVAAVALCGPDLHAELRTLFDWRPLGPSVVLTEVEPGCIRRIDGLPAFEHYRKNLAIQRDEDLYLLEFPLLLEREGRLFARNPLSVETDGGIQINADAFTGERARLGYLDVGALGASIHRTVAGLRRFGPEAVFIYSCVCRLYTLQDETEMETLPFQSLAPTSGFFTSGEFCRLGDEAQLLNSSEVVVALREGPRSESAHRGRWRRLPPCQFERRASYPHDEPPLSFHRRAHREPRRGSGRARSGGGAREGDLRGEGESPQGTAASSQEQHGSHLEHREPRGGKGARARGRGKPSRSSRRASPRWPRSTISSTSREASIRSAWPITSAGSSISRLRAWAQTPEA